MRNCHSCQVLNTNQRQCARVHMFGSSAVGVAETEPVHRLVLGAGPGVWCHGITHHVAIDTSGPGFKQMPIESADTICLGNCGSDVTVTPFMYS